MRSISLIRGTSHLSAFLFTHAPRAYTAFYNAYKQLKDRTTIALVRSITKPGMCVVDIGANIGFYTNLLADCVGPSGHVYAFEPDETNYGRLVAATRRYAHVQALRAAVTDVDATVDLYLSAKLNVDHRTFHDDDPSRTKVVVQGLSVDSFFRSSGTSLQFMKIDVQGAEYRALLGMRETVRRSPDLVILMEIWPHLHDRFGAGVETLLDLVDSWGFEVRRIVSSGSLGERISSGTPLLRRADPDFQFDVLCYRTGRVGFGEQYA